MNCDFFKKVTATPVFSPKCLKMFEKKTFYGTPAVAASESGFEEFLRISKGGLYFYMERFV